MQRKTLFKIGKSEEYQRTGTVWNLTVLSQGPYLFHLHVFQIGISVYKLIFSNYDAYKSEKQFGFYAVTINDLILQISPQLFYSISTSK